MSFNWAPVDNSLSAMEYSKDQFQSSPLSRSDSFENVLRPRLRTWPVAELANHSYMEDTQPAILDDRHGSPDSETGLGKRSRRCETAPKSNAQHSKTHNQRRKLTTHKLSAKSYVDLITDAILSTVDKRMTLADIYKWMVENVPCFKEQANVSASCGWKNAVRHTLSLHKRFKRVQRGRLQKPAWWTVEDSEYGHGVMSEPVVKKRSPDQTLSNRRHSEGCFDSFGERFQGFSSPIDHTLFPAMATEWSMPNANNGMTTISGSPNYNPSILAWETGSAPMQASHTGFGGFHGMKPEDDKDLPYLCNGDHNALTRSGSDASSVSSYSSSTYPHSIDYSDESGIHQAYKPPPQVYSYDNIGEYGNDEVQPAFVQTEHGKVGQINVPMPLRVDIRQQATSGAQTVNYISNNDFPKCMVPLHYRGPRCDGDAALPHDLLSVQVDCQVQCNVAEVLAYEMRASFDAGENATVNELYDLLKAGCALD